MNVFLTVRHKGSRKFPDMTENSGPDSHVRMTGSGLYGYLKGIGPGRHKTARRGLECKFKEYPSNHRVCVGN